MIFFTSIHIEEFEIKQEKQNSGRANYPIFQISPTKAFRDLDETGVIRIGAEVKSRIFL